jgi:glycosyltransferase involved in cell wall biosynthesis
MRIVHVISGLGQGGAETVLYRLIAQTPDIAHEVAALSGPGRYSEALEALGVRVHHLGRGVGALPRLHSIVRDSGADIVQCWMYRANLIGGVAGRMAGVPVIWNIRCTRGPSLGPASELLARICGMLAGFVPDFTVNCSARSAEDHGRIGYDRADGAVIPNGYDPAHLRPDDTARAATRREFEISPDKFLIGSITRWIAYKDVPNLLAALQLAGERGVDAVCVLVGNGLSLENPALAAAIRAAGCDNCVRALGKRRDIPDLARAMDLHVLASAAGEGFPNAVAETMASGTPNIVTDVGDAAMIVAETGWIVPPGDPYKLAEAIEQAYREFDASPGQWDERRMAARSRIVDNFSLERTVAAYRAIWQRFAGQAARGQ